MDKDLLKIGFIFIAVVSGLIVFSKFSKSSWPAPQQFVACNRIPDFSSYPVSQVYPGKIRSVDLESNTMAKEMSAQILASTGSAVNFGGNYYLVSGNMCGQSCDRHAIIDVKTGQILLYGLDTTGGVEIRRDSHLIKTNPTGRDPTRYYDFKDNKLLYLCEEPK